MKKKIVALCLVVCLLAIAIVGGTLAYFTDTDAKVNTFTMGNVDITLTEPNYQGTGDTGELHVYPGQTYAKDPTITVADDSEDCYIVATVTISNREDLRNLYANDPTVNQPWGLSLAGNAGIVSGGVASYSPTTTSDNDMPGTMLKRDGTDVAFVTYEAEGDNIVYTYYFKEIHKENDKEVLFETVTIPSIIDNNDIDGNLTITVNAYAIQAVGFTNVYDAYAAYVAQGH